MKAIVIRQFGNPGVLNLEDVPQPTLEEVLPKAALGIRFNEHMELDDGEVVFYHACKLGLEGSCRSGRTPTYPRRRSSARSRAAPMLLSHGLTIHHKNLPGK